MILKAIILFILILLKIFNGFLILFLRLSTNLIAALKIRAFVIQYFEYAYELLIKLNLWLGFFQTKRFKYNTKEKQISKSKHLLYYITKIWIGFIFIYLNINDYLGITRQISQARIEKENKCGQKNNQLAKWYLVHKNIRVILGRMEGWLKRGIWRILYY